MEIITQSTCEDLRKAAHGLGFPLFGVTSASESPGFARFCRWLDQGYAGNMDYLSKRRDAYRHPSSVMENVETLVMLGMPYQPAKSRRKKRSQNDEAILNSVSDAIPFEPSKDRVDSHSMMAALGMGTGRVAAYATGIQDYHDLIHLRLKQLASTLTESFPNARFRGVVDTAPLLEREFASLAGLGWIGKNTLLLNQNAGSYFFLAAMLTDLKLDHHSQAVVDHCGSCTACLDACPTQAFPQPHVLDATRCISYLTIEHRGAIPIEFRESIGSWVFGCDVCQQVCPWNRMAKPTQERSLRPQLEFEAFDLLELLSLDEVAFRQKYRKTPLWRTRRNGMLRNAIIVLGNQKIKEAIPHLFKMLINDDSILRSTAAWAIGRIGGDESLSKLRERLSHETNIEVHKEIVDAIEMITQSK